MIKYFFIYIIYVFWFLSAINCGLKPVQTPSYGLSSGTLQEIKVAMTNKEGVNLIGTQVKSIDIVNKNTILVNKSHVIQIKKIKGDSKKSNSKLIINNDKLYIDKILESADKLTSNKDHTDFTYTSNKIIVALDAKKLKKYNQVAIPPVIVCVGPNNEGQLTVGNVPTKTLKEALKYGNLKNSEDKIKKIFGFTEAQMKALKIYTKQKSKKKDGDPPKPDPKPPKLTTESLFYLSTKNKIVAENFLAYSAYKIGNSLVIIVKKQSDKQNSKAVVVKAYIFNVEQITTDSEPDDLDIPPKKQVILPEIKFKLEDIPDGWLQTLGYNKQQVITAIGNRRSEAEQLLTAILKSKGGNIDNINFVTDILPQLGQYLKVN